MATLMDMIMAGQQGQANTSAQSPYGMMPPAASFTGMTDPAALRAGSPAMPPLPPPRNVGPAPGMNMPMPRPAMQQQAPAALPSVREGFMQRLLGGPAYQSNGMPLISQPQGPMASGAPIPAMMQAQTPQQINFGDPESSADFFRADQALRGLLG